MEGIFGVIVFVIIFVVGFIVAVVSIVVKATKAGNEYKETQSKSVEAYRTHSGSTTSSNTTMTDEQRRRLEYLREQYKQVSEKDKHERHQEDAHEHGHTGEEEHYEEIVGSLGEINDEGCIDLSGVRFIAHDLAYDTSNSEQHDYTELAKAMVLGEIVNSPRFKTPYKRK